MSISYTIPKQGARYIPTSTLFEAFFGAVIPGRYDFTGTALCQNVVTIRLQPGSVYLIERVSVGGNIPEEDFFGSIVDFPKLTFKKSILREIVYREPLPISRYMDGLECSAWIKSEKGGDDLTLSMSGSCIQLPSMIGIASLKLNVSLSIYAIEDQKFTAEFNNRVC